MELLIVVVVIAILAAITIIAYNGITKSATESSMKSDLRNAATTLEVDKTTSGSYPEDGSSTDDGRWLRSSGSNELTYVLKPYGYCVAATHPSSPKIFRLKSNSGQIDEGSCETTVSTLAGSGEWGNTNGTGTAASFAFPTKLDVDSSGNVYVADFYNHRIRKITSDGTVTTLAGSTQGYVNDTGAAAQFSFPSDVAVDEAGNVFVADNGNNRIRKVTPSGAVTTIAGSGVSGYLDGTGLAAQFTSPNGIAVDLSGNVFVGEESHRIRKITPAGVTSTVAGSGVAGFTDGVRTAAQFYFPNDIDVTTSGVLYVADQSNHRIRRILPDGNVSTLAGSGVAGNADGPAASASFDNPNGVSVDASGVVYVADSGRVRAISTSGTVFTVAGSDYGYADGSGATALFMIPRGVAATTDGTLFVADEEGNRIRKITQ